MKEVKPYLKILLNSSRYIYKQEKLDNDGKDSKITFKINTTRIYIYMYNVILLLVVEISCSFPPFNPLNFMWKTY